ncbi:hypothetical protein BDFG_05954 [Blastomyces dermatitidis ATCC 26199]|nr:hypothetical protein BDFG_05954 [Blastomyces dermatitidis ATCC 26199]
MSYFANAKTPKSIVHISSIVGQDPAPVTPIYCATQARDQRLRQIPSNLRWSWHPYVWVTPEEVAEAMLALAERDEANELTFSDSKEAGCSPDLGGKHQQT